MSQTKWNLYVGIDFGTYGCGISYTLPNGKSYIHNKWDTNDANVKSKTCVLLNKDNEIESVGNKAEEMFFNSRLPKKLFKSFKMALYDDTHKIKIVNINNQFNHIDKLKDTIKATNDSNVSVEAEVVFVGELKFLKKQAFDFIKTHFVNKYNIIGDINQGFSNVQYFLTVPGISVSVYFFHITNNINCIYIIIAIWGDKAKQKMYNWGVKAGIVSGNIEGQLQIVYEPDCASLSLQHAIFKNIESKTDIKDNNDIERLNNTDIKPYSSIHYSNPTDILDDDDSKDDVKDDNKTDDSLELKEILMSIKLPKYYQMFLEQGFTSIADIKAMTNPELKDYVGITNGLHRMRIHQAIQSYNNNTFEELNPQINIRVPLKSGDKYILIDIGGGTCDFACHKIEGNCVISELYHPSGGSWGSCNINTKFTYFIDEIFSIEAFDLYGNKKKRNDTDDGRIAYLEFLQKFEIAKKQFGSKYTDNLYDFHYPIEIPNSFITHLLNEWSDDSALNVAETLQELRNALKKKKIWDVYHKDSKLIANRIDGLDINHITQFKMSDQDKIYGEFVQIVHINNKYHLLLHNNLWFLMFNEIIEPIIKHCDDLLKMNELNDTKYLFLVGGFAESKYFQNYIKGYFKEYVNIEIVVPNLPGLCVVDGASKSGLYPNFVKIRKMSKYYGVGINRSQSLLSDQISPEYIKNHTIIKDKTSYVTGIFSPFVAKNESVKFDDQPKVHEYKKFYKYGTSIRITIYSSDKDNPLILVDCHKMGELIIPIPRNKQEIMIEFMFGQTILTVYAYQKGFRQNRRQIKIDYQNTNQQTTQQNRFIFWK